MANSKSTSAILTSNMASDKNEVLGRQKVVATPNKNSNVSRMNDDDDVRKQNAFLRLLLLLLCMKANQDVNSDNAQKSVQSKGGVKRNTKSTGTDGEKQTGGPKNLNTGASTTPVTEETDNTNDTSNEITDSTDHLDFMVREGAPVSPGCLIATKSINSKREAPTRSTSTRTNSSGITSAEMSTKTSSTSARKVKKAFAVYVPTSSDLNQNNSVEVAWQEPGSRAIGDDESNNPFSPNYDNSKYNLNVLEHGGQRLQMRRQLRLSGGDSHSHIPFIAECLPQNSRKFELPVAVPLTSNIKSSVSSPKAHNSDIQGYTQFSAMVAKQLGGTRKVVQANYPRETHQQAIQAEAVPIPSSPYQNGGLVGLDRNGEMYRLPRKATTRNASTTLPSVNEKVERRESLPPADQNAKIKDNKESETTRKPLQRSHSTSSLSTNKLLGYDDVSSLATNSYLSRMGGSFMDDMSLEYYENGRYLHGLYPRRFSWGNQYHAQRQLPPPPKQAPVMHQHLPKRPDFSHQPPTYTLSSLRDLERGMISHHHSGYTSNGSVSSRMVGDSLYPPYNGFPRPQLPFHQPSLVPPMSMYGVPNQYHLYNGGSSRVPPGPNYYQPFYPNPYLHSPLLSHSQHPPSLGQPGSLRNLGMLPQAPPTEKNDGSESDSKSHLSVGAWSQTSDDFRDLYQYYRDQHRELGGIRAGVHATKQAFENGNVLFPVCMLCQVELVCVASVEFVLCLQCKGVSPSGTSGRATTNKNGGIGVGIPSSRFQMNH